QLDRVKLSFRNRGTSAAVLHVRSGDNQLGPWTYTVDAKDRLSDVWSYGELHQNTYDLSVYGPNGFVRTFKGGLGPQRGANLLVSASYHHDPGITLEIVNRTKRREQLKIYDAYSRRTITQRLEAGGVLVWHWSLDESFGWYDLIVTVDSDPSFRQQLAGHIETGRDSVSDPLLGV
ncbi:MAG TPA: phospholipase domain-containing protein, partial [Polyangiaceae bacterium]|nr:phospholipase domain-containing protein [Polyangiaceae bacterium]